MKIYKTNKDWSSINKSIYLRKNKLPRQKNRSTYNTKKILKDRELKFDKNNILKDIVYFSGFSKSIQESKHLILTKNIKVNNIIISQPNYKIKSGDVITCLDNKSLLCYYMQRWNSIQINSSFSSSSSSSKIDNHKFLDLDKVLLEGGLDELKKESLKDNYYLGKKTYKKYKFMIPNKKIHRISYNCIVWL